MLTRDLHFEFLSYMLGWIGELIKRRIYRLPQLRTNHEDAGLPCRP